MILLGVALTATAFTWRLHVADLRANGKELASLSVDGYPGAQALLDGARVPQLPFRPTVLEAADDLPVSTNDGCISDFDNAGIINCTYGDLSATRTIALAVDPTPSIGSPPWTCWVRSTISGRHLPEDGLSPDH